MGKIVAALRRMGFDEVYDTTLGADLTVVEESGELFERLEKGENLPLITSCCPGWVQFCEKKFPEFLPNVSTCRSPMQMMASLIKDQDKQKREAGDKQHFHVAIMPCTAKKFEAVRDEFKTDGKDNVDAVITTQELILMIKESGLMFDALEPEAVDMPFGTVSGAGVIFGVTGGVTEAVLRLVVSNKTRAALITVANAGQRGDEGIKEFDVEYGERTLKLAVVSGLGNADKLLNRIKAGEHFDFIEIMACPGGCVNGGGQPFAGSERQKARTKGLYDTDRMLSIRRAEENPIVSSVYKHFIGDRAHELLHVDYIKNNQ
jgi:NADH-quinone oxidoreductase subunit G